MHIKRRKGIMGIKRLLGGVMATILLAGLTACALPEETVSLRQEEDTKPAAAAEEVEVEEVAPMDEQNSVWNVMDFGAAGDGQTDDYEALRRAVDTVLSAGGGTVYFPEGTYRLSQTLTIGAAGEAPLTLLADPAASVTLTTDAAVAGPVVYVDHPHVTINHVNMSCTTREETPGLVLASEYGQLESVTVFMGAGNTQPGIVVYGSYNTVKNSGVSVGANTEYMISFSKKPGIAAYGNVLEDTHFGGVHGKCVLVTSEDENGCQENLTIRRNVFLVVSCDQVEVQAGRDVYIQDNMLDAAGVCILLDPLPVGIDGLQVTDNYCGASSGGDRTSGLRTQDTFGGTIRRVIVSANYFWASNPIFVVSEKHTAFTFTDNYIVLTGGNALYMKTAAGSYMEGNAVSNLSGTVSLYLEAVDQETVIQYNTWGGDVSVPDWSARFEALN
jgi:hypothetical protein